jgi:hypothetical protein
VASDAEIFHTSSVVPIRLQKIKPCHSERASRKQNLVIPSEARGICFSSPQAPSPPRPQLLCSVVHLRSLIYNQFLTLSGLPKETYDYRLGNRSALEWVIDQYQVSTDKRSGITNDPNREDDPQYILRLIGQVIPVSQFPETPNSRRFERLEGFSAMHLPPCQPPTKYS